MRINRKTKPFFLRVILSLTLIIPAFIFITSCSSGDSGSAKLPLKTLPNIIVIVMDTVRYDHLSCYGYHRDTTPNLIKLTKESRLYLNAYSTSCWTPASHASLFTGLYPVAHGSTQENYILPLEPVTMAEALLERGYQTYAISENPLVSKDNQFDQGFQYFFEGWRQPNFHYSDGAFNVFKEFLSQRDMKKPFFLFINMIEPHSPYDSARFFQQRFTRHKDVDSIGNRFMDVVTGKKTFSPKEVQHLIDLYDGEIMYTDYLVGQIVGKLKDAHAWDNTLMVVTSDHGENFMEHGLTDHVFMLNQELIHIPLLIKFPALFPGGSRESAPVQLTDIFHTLRDIVGLDKRKIHTQGCSLLNNKELEKRTVLAEYYAPRQVFTAIRNREMPLTEEYKKRLESDKNERKKRLRFVRLKEIFPGLEKYHRRIRTVISGQYKLIWGSDGNHQLYNLKNDKNEQENLANKKQYVKIKLKLLKRLNKLIKRYKNESPVRGNKKKRKKSDKKTDNALKTLGYI